MRSIRHAPSAGQVHERVRPLGYVVHLSEQRHEQRGLARTRRPNDEVDLPALEEDLVVDPEDERSPARASGRDGDGGRVCRPGEGRVANADGVLQLVGNRSCEDLSGVRLRGFSVLVDELGL